MWGLHSYNVGIGGWSAYIYLGVKPSNKRLGSFGLGYSSASLGLYNHGTCTATHYNQRYTTKDTILRHPSLPFLDCTPWRGSINNKTCCLTVAVDLHWFIVCLLIDTLVLSLPHCRHLLHWGPGSRLDSQHCLGTERYGGSTQMLGVELHRHGDSSSKGKVLHLLTGCKEQSLSHSKKECGYIYTMHSSYCLQHKRKFCGESVYYSFADIKTVTQTISLTGPPKPTVPGTGCTCQLWAPTNSAPNRFSW